MATVYLARDLRHDRDVALKVLRPELAAILGPDRFLREIKTTAQLAHPHILPLLDSGDAAGTLFYVMPYVEGESLRDRLTREKQLPLDDALQLTREVADALSYAHGRGVVHRDIKPENILIASGHAVVADFGIAKAIAAAGSARLTETGLAVGTPAYMSPEQASAEADIDGRSDIYSLGCVLYEMLAGEPPFTGVSAQAVVAKRLGAPAPRISILRNRVPPHVEQALDTALARTPADRFATASQFAQALGGASSGQPSESVGRRRRARRVPALVTGLLAVAAGVGVAIKTGALRSSLSPAGDAEALRSVAVLPFTSLGDSTRAYLGDGFTDAVIDALARVEGLRVPASGRVFPYRGRTRDVREIGRELAVGMVVTGSVQVVGDRLRVWTQLVKVDDGTSVWSHQYNGDLAGIFPTQDSIATGIVAALQVRIASIAGGTAGRGVRTRDPRAYELYVRARRTEFTRTGVEQGITLLEEALARDSSFADAWVALADAYWVYAAFGGLPPAELASRWRRAAERGIALDSLNGWAFSLRGTLRMLYDWDWDGARGDMRRAVHLSPASADAAMNYALFLNTVGEPDSALAQMRRAVAIDPANPFMLGGLATGFRFAGMADSARATAERVLALDSIGWGIHNLLSQLFAVSGRRVEAEREIELMLRGAGEESPLVLGLAANYYGLAGRPDRARELRRQLEELGRRQYVESTYLAAARLGSGDRAGALGALEDAARNHELDLAFELTVQFELLDGEPRYEAVRRRVFGNRPAPRGWRGLPPS